MLTILKQTETFRKWSVKLKDQRARGLIASRLDRLGFGHWGRRGACWKRHKRTAYPLRPGYRLYVQKRGDTLVVLLCGGDKSWQAKDIRAAKQLAEEWSE